MIYFHIFATEKNLYIIKIFYIEYKKLKITIFNMNLINFNSKLMKNALTQISIDYSNIGNVHNVYIIKNSLYIFSFSYFNNIVKFDIKSNEISYISIKKNEKLDISININDWLLVKKSVLYSCPYFCKFIIKINTDDDSVTKIKLPGTKNMYNTEKKGIVHNKNIYFMLKEQILQLDIETDKATLIPCVYSSTSCICSVYSNYIYFYNCNHRSSNDNILKFDMITNDLKVIEIKNNVINFDNYFLNSYKLVKNNVHSNDIYFCPYYPNSIVKINTTNDDISFISKAYTYGLYENMYLFGKWL